MKNAGPRTDTGTVVLHWALAVAVLIALVTGLRFSIDNRTVPGLHWIGWALPQGDLWNLHLGAGTAMTAIVAAWVGYLRAARLGPRVRLDRARLHTLLQSGKQRWSAANVALVWLLICALAGQFVSGILLMLGHAGLAVTIHVAGAWMIVAGAAAHVGAHLATGGVAQLLRICRPERLTPRREPVSLAEAFAAHLKAQDAERQNPHDSRAHATAQPHAPRTIRVEAHPLAVAAASGLTALSVLVSLDNTTRDTLTIAAVAPADAPLLDGDLSDPAWRRARPVTINTTGGANFGGTGTSRIEVRAVHDGTTAYMAFVWDDPTRSLKHLPLIKRADGWHLLNDRYDIEDETAYYEDKFAVMFARNSALGGGGAIHLGERPLAGKPGGLAGRGLHYTTDGGIVDVWHWKATRGGLLGFMDDNYFGPPDEPTAAEVAGKSRYKAGYKTDPGSANYANNFKAEPPGGYRGPLQPLRLPKSIATQQAVMGGLTQRIDLAPEQGEPDGARWSMLEDETVPYSAEADAALPIGTVIPGVLIRGAYGGDRADVRAAARWSGGRWTLEIARRLDTRSAFDVPIANDVVMWVAAFDHSQIRHSRHMRPVKLEVKP